MGSNKGLKHIMQKSIKMLQAGNRDSAIQLLTDYCKKRPNDAETRRDIGIFLQQNNMPFKAESFYLDALRINNDHAVIHFNLGVIYQNINMVNQAIKSYKRAIDVSANYTQAYANLGYLYKQTGDITKCRQACLIAQRLEPENPQVKHMIASLGINEAPEAASQDYIKNLYDNYAEKYDQHLSITLKSKVPELIYKATLALYNRDTESGIIENINILDLGCGTGISGELFSKHTNKMVGIDLSEKMIAEAKKKDIYSSLIISDITEYLNNNSEMYDIIISSDVLIYFGNLHNVFKGATKALHDGGLFSFSIEALSEESGDYSLKESGRYKHNHKYISNLAEENNLSILSATKTVLRQQNNEDVKGRIYVLKNSSVKNT